MKSNPFSVETFEVVRVWRKFGTYINYFPQNNSYRFPVLGEGMWSVDGKMGDRAGSDGEHFYSRWRISLRDSEAEKEMVEVFGDPFLCLKLETSLCDGDSYEIEAKAELTREQATQLRDALTKRLEETKHEDLG